MMGIFQRVSTKLKNSKLFKFLFPPRCILCHKFMDGNVSGICRACFEKQDIDKTPPKKIKGEFFDGAIFVYPFQNEIRTAMHRYKYRRGTFIAPIFGELMAQRIFEENLDGFDIITWVPVHFTTKWKRGYDQAEMLAEQVSRFTDIHSIRLLKKVRRTMPMNKLGVAERRANVLGAFKTVCENSELEGLRILLIDDTLTTGATISECARMLKTSGAASVMGVAFCKTILKKENIVRKLR